MKFKMIILIAVLFLHNIFLYGFNMSKTSFDKRVDNGEGYTEVVFTNETSNVVRYRFNVEKVEGDDLSEYITVSPKIMSIPPFEKRTLKIFGDTSKGKMMNGEYQFDLKVDQIVVPTLAKEGDKITGKTTLAFTPIVRMYAHVGDPDFKQNINFKNLKVVKNSENKYFLTGVMVNSSYAGKQIGIKYIGKNGFILGGKWLGRIKAHSEKKLELMLETDAVKEVVLYDADTLETFKQIKVNN